MYKTWEDEEREEKIVLWAFVIGLGIAIILILWFFVPFDLQVTLTHRSWSKDQYIDRWQENQRADWSVPPTGKVINTERKFHHSESYACGTTTETHTVNGKVTTSTKTKWCSRSVYRDWYTFLIWEWTEIRHSHAEGTTKVFHDPDASDFDAANKTNPERLGRKVEVYTVFFEDKDKRQYSLDVTQEVYLQLQDNETYLGHANRLNGIYAVDTKE